MEEVWRGRQGVLKGAKESGFLGWDLKPALPGHWFIALPLTSRL